MQKASLPKGTRDFGPEVMKRRKHIMRVIEDVYVNFGFEPIETPAMEKLSTLTGKYGDEGDQLLFKILDSGDYLDKVDPETLSNKDVRKLTPQIATKGLRYDLTVPFARFVVQNQTDITFPFRRYQMQPVWRADRPQKGRYREFWQCDADVIGTKSLICEADFIHIYEAVFRKLGLSNYELRINHRKVLEAIAVSTNFEGSFTDLTVAIDKLDKIGWEGVTKELSTRGMADDSIALLKTFMNKAPFTRERLEQLRDTLKDCPEKETGLSELNDLMDYLDGTSFSVMLDLSLARGLDYYTGCIFEAVIPESGIGSVSGGGRYDDLTGIFGLKDVSGIGISFGLDRIYDVMIAKNLFSDSEVERKLLFCHFDDDAMKFCAKLAPKLRAAGIDTVVYPDRKKIGKQFDYANKSGYKWVAVVGDNEITENVVQLKDMESGNQEKVPAESLSEWLT